ncbi:polyprotein [Xingshan cricket virus]|uniref:polyprotein n=1 Tax=Xingshan cricket virus TaxID=1746072 RepID=UPI0007069B40|nr:polyprotein [Xingshan cricket virus]ALL52882.1 polyprotein [Xingshan cricket virus]
MTTAFSADTGLLRHLGLINYGTWLETAQERRPALDEFMREFFRTLVSLTDTDFKDCSDMIQASAACLDELPSSSGAELLVDEFLSEFVEVERKEVPRSAPASVDDISAVRKSLVVPGRRDNFDEVIINIAAFESCLEDKQSPMLVTNHPKLALSEKSSAARLIKSAARLNKNALTVCLTHNALTTSANEMGHAKVGDCSHCNILKKVYACRARARGLLRERNAKVNNALALYESCNRRELGTFTPLNTGEYLALGGYRQVQEGETSVYNRVHLDKSTRNRHRVALSQASGHYANKYNVLAKYHIDDSWGEDVVFKKSTKVKGMQSRSGEPSTHFTAFVKKRSRVETPSNNFWNDSKVYRDLREPPMMARVNYGVVNEVVVKKTTQRVDTDNLVPSGDDAPRIPTTCPYEEGETVPQIPYNSGFMDQQHLDDYRRAQAERMRREALIGETIVLPSGRKRVVHVAGAAGRLALPPPGFALNQPKERPSIAEASRSTAADDYPELPAPSDVTYRPVKLPSGPVRGGVEYQFGVDHTYRCDQDSCGPCSCLSHAEKLVGITEPAQFTAWDSLPRTIEVGGTELLFEDPYRIRVTKGKHCLFAHHVVTYRTLKKSPDIDYKDIKIEGCVFLNMAIFGDYKHYYFEITASRRAITPWHVRSYQGPHRNLMAYNKVLEICGHDNNIRGVFLASKDFPNPGRIRDVACRSPVVTRKEGKVVYLLRDWARPLSGWNHRHTCRNCGSVYNHEHKYRRLDHKQRAEDCPVCANLVLRANPQEGEAQVVNQQHCKKATPFSGMLHGVKWVAKADHNQVEGNCGATHCGAPESVDKMHCLPDVYTDGELLKLRLVTTLRSVTVPVSSTCVKVFPVTGSVVTHGRIGSHRYGFSKVPSFDCDDVLVSGTPIFDTETGELVSVVSTSVNGRTYAITNLAYDSLDFELTGPVTLAELDKPSYGSHYGDYAEIKAKALVGDAGGDGLYINLDKNRMKAEVVSRGRSVFCTRRFGGGACWTNEQHSTRGTGRGRGRGQRIVLNPAYVGRKDVLKTVNHQLAMATAEAKVHQIQAEAEAAKAMSASVVRTAKQAVATSSKATNQTGIVLKSQQQVVDKKKTITKTPHYAKWIRAAVNSITTVAIAAALGLNCCSAAVAPQDRVVHNIVKRAAPDPLRETLARLISRDRIDAYNRELECKPEWKYGDAITVADTNIAACYTKTAASATKLKDCNPTLKKIALMKSGLNVAFLPKTVEAMNAYNEDESKLIACVSCYTDLARVSMLAAHTISGFTNDYIGAPELAIVDCVAKVASISETLKHAANESSVESMPASPHTISGCHAPVHAWKEHGHLANRDGHSCSLVDNMNMTFSNKECVKHKYFTQCHSQPDSECRLGFGNVSTSGTVYTGKKHAMTGDICCSLGCFSEEELLLSFSNQPLCSPCIKFFRNVFWDSCEFEDHRKDFEGIQIFSDKTVFILTGSRRECKNRLSFSSCCEGRGAVPSGDEANYFDKYCACAFDRHTTVATWLKKVQQVVRLVFEHPGFTALVVIALVRPNGRFLWIVLILALTTYQWAYVSAACTVNNIVPLGDSSTYETSNIDQFTVSLSAGDCISISGATLEVKEVRITHSYQFEMAVPFKTKLICHTFDWGCQGGRASSVWGASSDCYIHCGVGIRVKITDTVSSWAGAGCFLLNGIAARYDACFSVGAPQTFSLIYNRMTDNPRVEIDAIIHQGHLESRVIVNQENSKTSLGFSMRTIGASTTTYPHQIVRRNSEVFCTYHYSETNKLCASNSLEDLTNIDPDCLEAKIEWDVKEHQYALTYKNHDFESVLRDHYVTCPTSANVTWNKYSAVYTSKTDSVNVEITGHHFTLGEVSTPMCNKGEYSLSSEPGVQGYHKTTSISLISEKACCVGLSSHECEATSGGLLCSKTTAGRQSSVWWCNGNETTEFTVMLSGNSTERINLAVVVNWKPHLNVWKTWNLPTTDSFSVSGSAAWVSNILSQVGSKITSFFGGDWTSKVVIIVFGYLGCVNLLRGKVLAGGILLGVAYISWIFPAAYGLDVSQVTGNTINATFDSCRLLVVLLTWASGCGYGVITKNKIASCWPFAGVLILWAYDFEAIVLVTLLVCVYVYWAMKYIGKPSEEVWELADHNILLGYITDWRDEEDATMFPNPAIRYCTKDGLVGEAVNRPVEGLRSSPVRTPALNLPDGTVVPVSAEDINLELSRMNKNPSLAYPLVCTSHELQFSSGTYWFMRDGQVLAACGATHCNPQTASGHEAWMYYLEQSHLDSLMVYMNSQEPFRPEPGNSGKWDSEKQGLFIGVRGTEAIYVAVDFIIRVDKLAETVTNDGAWSFDVSVEDGVYSVGSCYYEVEEQQLVGAFGDTVDNPQTIRGEGWYTGDISGILVHVNSTALVGFASVGDFLSAIADDKTYVEYVQGPVSRAKPLKLEKSTLSIQIVNEPPKFKDNNKLNEPVTHQHEDVEVEVSFGHLSVRKAGKNALIANVSEESGASYCGNPFVSIPDELIIKTVPSKKTLVGAPVHYSNTFYWVVERTELESTRVRLCLYPVHQTNQLQLSDDSWVKTIGLPVAVDPYGTKYEVVRRAGCKVALRNPDLWPNHVASNGDYACFDTRCNGNRQLVTSKIRDNWFVWGTDWKDCAGELRPLRKRLGLVCGTAVVCEKDVGPPTVARWQKVRLVRCNANIVSGSFIYQNSSFWKPVFTPVAVVTATVLINGINYIVLSSPYDDSGQFNCVKRSWSRVDRTFNIANAPVGDKSAVRHYAEEQFGKVKKTFFLDKNNLSHLLLETTFGFQTNLTYKWTGEHKHLPSGPSEGSLFIIGSARLASREWLTAWNELLDANDRAENRLNNYGGTFVWIYSNTLSDWREVWVSILKSVGEQTINHVEIDLSLHPFDTADSSQLLIYAETHCKRDGGKLTFLYGTLERTLGLVQRNTIFTPNTYCLQLLQGEWRDLTVNLTHTDHLSRRHPSCDCFVCKVAEEWFKIPDEIRHYLKKTGLHEWAWRALGLDYVEPSEKKRSQEAIVYATRKATGGGDALWPLSTKTATKVVRLGLSVENLNLRPTSKLANHQAQDVEAAINIWLQDQPVSHVLTKLIKENLKWLDGKMKGFYPKACSYKLVEEVYPVPWRRLPELALKNQLRYLQWPEDSTAKQILVEPRIYSAEIVRGTLIQVVEDSPAGEKFVATAKRFVIQHSCASHKQWKNLANLLRNLVARNIHCVHLLGCSKADILDIRVDWVTAAQLVLLVPKFDGEDKPDSIDQEWHVELSLNDDGSFFDTIHVNEAQGTQLQCFTSPDDLLSPVHVSGICLSRYGMVDQPPENSRLFKQFGVGVCRTINGVGSFVVNNNSLATSYHVTKGNNLTVTHGSEKFTFVKHEMLKGADLAVYNRECQLSTAHEGDILMAFNPATLFSQLFKVVSIGPASKDRPGLFYQMVPVEYNGSDIVLSPWQRFPGMSGSPVINSTGELVTIYGLGTTITQETAGETLTTLMQHGPIKTIGAVNLAFFERAVERVLTPEAKQAVYCYLCAPTGTGKTTQFVSLLLKKLQLKQSITLLQPTVTACRNTYLFIGQLLLAEKGSFSNWRVTCDIGKRNENAHEEQNGPAWDGTGPQLHIYTSEKWYVNCNNLMSDFIILDECHKINDRDMVKTDIYCETVVGPNPKIVYVKMTASPICVEDGFDLAGGQRLVSTNYDIECPKLRIIQGEGELREGEICLPGEVFSRRSNKKYAMRPDATGNTLVFVSTRAQCVQGAQIIDAALRSLPGSKWNRSVPLNAGCPGNVSQIATPCFIIATNYVEQSITIQNLSDVIDWEEENTWRVTVNQTVPNPQTKFYEVIYSSSNQVRSISLESAMQRKGRCGRVRTGRYWTPADNVQLESRRYDESIIPELLLSINEKIGEQIWSRYSNKALVEALQTVTFLLPERLNSRMVYGPGMTRLANIVRGWNDIWGFVRSCPCDSVGLYLMPVATKELHDGLLALCEKRENSRPCDVEQFPAWWTHYVSLVGLNDDVSVFFGTRVELGMVKSQFSAEYSDLFVSDAMRIESGMDTSGTVQDSYALPFATGLAAIGCLLAGSAGLGLAIDKHATRQIVEYYDIKHVDVVRVARWCYKHRSTPKFSKKIKSAWAIVLAWFKDNWKRLKDKVNGLLGRNSSPDTQTMVPSTSGVTPPNSEVQDNWDYFLTQCGVAVELAYAKISLIAPWFIWPHLAPIFGNGVLGGMYQTLCESIGTCMTCILLTVCNALILFFGGVSVFVASAVTSLISGIIASVVKSCNKSKRQYGAKVDDAGIWGLVASLAAGAGIGLAATSHLALITQRAHVTGYMGEALRITPSTTIGGFNNGYLIMKNAYYLVSRCQISGTADVIPALMDLIARSCIAGPITVVTATLSGVLIGTLYIFAKRYIAEYAKTARTGEPGLATWKEMVNNLDSMFDTIICGVAVLINPLSVVSIIIGCLNDFLLGRGACVSRNAVKYAGNNPIAALMGSIIDWCQYLSGDTAQQAEVHDSASTVLSVLGSASTLIWVFWTCGADIYAWLCRQFTSLKARFCHLFKLKTQELGKSVATGIIKSIPKNSITDALLAGRDLDDEVCVVASEGVIRSEERLYFTKVGLQKNGMGDHIMRLCAMRSDRVKTCSPLISQNVKNCVAKLQAPKSVLRAGLNLPFNLLKVLMADVLQQHGPLIRGKVTTLSLTEFLLETRVPGFEGIAGLLSTEPFDLALKVSYQFSEDQSYLLIDLKCKHIQTKFLMLFNRVPNAPQCIVELVDWVGISRNSGFQKIIQDFCGGLLGPFSMVGYKNSNTERLFGEHFGTQSKGIWTSIVESSIAVGAGLIAKLFAEITVSLQIFDNQRLDKRLWGALSIKDVLWLQHVHMVTVCVCLTGRKPVFSYDATPDPTLNVLPVFISGERKVTLKELDQCLDEAMKIPRGDGYHVPFKNGTNVFVTAKTTSGVTWCWKFTPGTDQEARTFNQHVGMLVLTKIHGGDCRIDRDHMLCGCCLAIDINTDRPDDAPPVKVLYLNHPKCKGHNIILGDRDSLEPEERVVSKEDWHDFQAFLQRFTFDESQPHSGDADPAVQAKKTETTIDAATNRVGNYLQTRTKKVVSWWDCITKKKDKPGDSGEEHKDAWELGLIRGAMRNAFLRVDPPVSTEWVKNIVEPINNLGLRLDKPIKTLGLERNSGADERVDIDPATELAEFYDVTDGVFKRLVHGFGHASFTPGSEWTGVERGEEFHPAIPPKAVKETYDFWSVLAHSKSRVVTKDTWSQIERAHVYALPYKGAMINRSGITEAAGRAASRGYYKFQGLYAQDPKFFTSNVKCILDPACGFGGFMHAYCQLLKNTKTRRYYLASTLDAKGHAAPEMDLIAQVGGPVNPVNLSSFLGESKGNLRDPRLTRIFEACLERLEHSGIISSGNERGKVDLIISDFGEVKDTEQAQVDVWLKAPTVAKNVPQQINCSQCTDLRQRKADPNRVCDSCMHLLQGQPPEYIPLARGIHRLLQKILRKGGKMLLKMTGVFSHIRHVLNLLIGKFTRVKISRAPTCSKFSPEFYIWCDGFEPTAELDCTMVDTVIAHASTELYTCYQEAQSILSQSQTKSQLKYLRPRHWGSWMKPTGETGFIHRNVDHAMGWPAGLRIKASDRFWEWKPDWLNRIELLKQRVAHSHVRRPKFVEIPHPYMTQVKVLGRWERGGTDVRFKNTKTGLVDDFASHCFSLTDNTATYTHTQCTAEFKAASIQKRLDIQCDELPRNVSEDFLRISELLMTEWGRAHLDSLGLMTKEEVLHDQNSKGACGFFSDSHNIREYQEKHPDWYERAMGLIECWSEGKPTASYMTAMHKSEPSMKKNASDGRIEMPVGCSSEDLKAFNGKTHRYIQFMDELTRLANYILVGKLLRLANENKIYKGTINGTPVMHQGKVMRAVWDSVNTRDPIVLEGDNPHIGVTYQPVPFDSEYQPDGQPHRLQGKPAAVGLDFSAFDGTVTAEELAIAALFFMKFFKGELKQAVWSWCMEEAFPIVVIRDGWMFVRGGQVCSGSLWTSLRNTLLSVINGVRAVAKSLGCSFEDVCKTVATVNFSVGEIHADTTTGALLHVPKIKTIEVMRIPVLADGDDQQIITEVNVAARITEHLPGHMREQCKTVHAGVGQTTALVTKFEDIQFCSHRYEPVLIGPGAVMMHGDDHKIDAVCRGHAAEQELISRLTGRQQSVFTEQLPATRLHRYQMWWLPSRHISNIFSRLRLSVKAATHRWDPTSEQCKMLTRSKIFSYLLMYPHIKTVRVACLTMLAKIGGDKVDFGEYYRRWGDLGPEILGSDSGTREPGTLAGAFQSVYGVNILDSISFRNPRVEAAELQDLRDNVAFEGNSFPKGKPLLGRMMRWLGTEVADHAFLAMDSSTSRAYCDFLATSCSLDAAKIRCGGNSRLLNTLQTCVSEHRVNVVDLFGPQALHDRVTIGPDNVARTPDGEVYDPGAGPTHQSFKTTAKSPVDEKYGNILSATMNNRSAILHCISADKAMSAGLAEKIDLKWGIRDRLPPAPDIGIAYAVPCQGSDMEGCARTTFPNQQPAPSEAHGGWVINMVTKSKKHNKPLLNTVVSTLHNALRQCDRLGVREIHLPRIGCGLDRLDWSQVREAIIPVLRRWMLEDTGQRSVTIWNADPLTHAPSTHIPPVPRDVLRATDIDAFQERVTEALEEVFGVRGIEGTDVGHELTLTCRKYLRRMFETRHRALASGSDEDRQKLREAEHEAYRQARLGKTSELTLTILKAQRLADANLRLGRPSQPVRKAARSAAEALVNAAQQGRLTKIEFLDSARNVPDELRASTVAGSGENLHTVVGRSTIKRPTTVAGSRENLHTVVGQSTIKCPTTVAGSAENLHTVVERSTTKRRQSVARSGQHSQFHQTAEHHTAKVVQGPTQNPRFVQALLPTKHEPPNRVDATRDNHRVSRGGSKENRPPFFRRFAQRGTSTSGIARPTSTQRSGAVAKRAYTVAGSVKPSSRQLKGVAYVVKPKTLFTGAYSSSAEKNIGGVIKTRVLQSIEPARNRALNFKERIARSLALMTSQPAAPTPAEGVPRRNKYDADWLESIGLPSYARAFRENAAS